MTHLEPSSHESEALQIIHAKIFPEAESLATQLEPIRKDSRIVFTNGCFDILHRGHLEYLARAKGHGEKLVVAINSDDSVRRLKGDSRPINLLGDRLFALAALSFVDYVTSFDGNTPEEVISILQPDIHVKGGDYTEDELPEAKIVRSYGGTILLIPFVQGYSTTGLIEKMNS